MGYFLGIDVGAVRTVAAVARSGSDGDAVDTVDLGDGDGRAGGVASVLHLGEDGTLAVGAAARARASTEPGRVVDGFPGRVGDGRPMLLAGEPWAPEELTAWLVRWVVDRVAERAGPAEAVAVIHPGSADADRARLLAAAVAEQDLDVAFVAAPDEDGPPARVDERTGDRAVRAVAASLRAAARSVPAPRSTASGEYGPRSTASGEHGPGRAAGPASTGEHTPDGGRPAPTTVNLDPDGFLGGMGATNTAGLLSGYTPPHGVSWPSGQVAVAVPDTAAGRDVDLPAQRSESGRWHATAPGGPVPGRTAPGEAVPGDAVPAGASAAPAPRTRNDPVVLVGAGGLAAVVAVVATLFLWPGPRTTDTAASRPLPAAPVAPVATASVLPTTEPAPTSSVVPTTTTVRPRPARTRRPAPPVTEPPSVVTTPPAPTESSDTPEPTTSPPSTEEPPDPEED